MASFSIWGLCYGNLLLLAYSLLIVTANGYADECKQAYSKVFDRNQEPLMAQETVIVLLWLRNKCQDGFIHVDAKRYIAMTTFDEDSCNEQRLKMQFNMEVSLAPNTNIAIYTRDYNQIFYNYCRAYLTQKLKNELNEKLTTEDKDFGLWVKILDHKLKSVLRSKRQVMNADDLRLKVVFLMMQDTENLDFLDDKQMYFFVKRKKLLQAFNNTIGARCLSVLKSVGETAGNLMIARRLLIGAPPAPNEWNELYLICGHALTHLNIWNIDLEWNRLKPALVDKVEDIAEDGTPPVAPTSELDKEISRYEVTKSIRLFKYISEDTTITEPLAIQKTLAIIINLMLFFEHTGNREAFEISSRYYSFSVINEDKCTPVGLVLKAYLGEAVRNQNVKSYTEFFVALQQKLCLENHQHEIAIRYQEFEDQQFARRLESLVYSAYNLFRQKIVQTQYRLQAALGYLMRYSAELVGATAPLNQRRLFDLFNRDIKPKCDVILEKVKEHEEKLNVLLDLADPTERASLLDKEVKYILMFVQVCRNLIETTTDGKLFKLYKKRLSDPDDKLSEDEAVSRHEIDIDHLELYHNPELNAEIEQAIRDEVLSQPRRPT